MKRLYGSLWGFGLLVTLVSCASSKDMERLRGQLNSYQSNSTAQIQNLQVNLHKMQDQLHMAQQSIDDMRGQLVQTETEQGTTTASQTARIQALIHALAQGYQAEVETYRRNLQRLEQAAKGFEQLSPVMTANPSEGANPPGGQPFSPTLSSEPR